MTLSKKTLAAKTTYSKWEKGDIRRIYLNSPILRWHGVTIYFDAGNYGYLIPHQNGKLRMKLLNVVQRKFSEYLVEKGIVNITDLNNDDWHLHFEKFDDLWNMLPNTEARKMKSITNLEHGNFR